MRQKIPSSILSRSSMHRIPSLRPLWLQAEPSCWEILDKARNYRRRVGLCARESPGWRKRLWPSPHCGHVRFLQTFPKRAARVLSDSGTSCQHAGWWSVPEASLTCRSPTYAEDPVTAKPKGGQQFGGAPEYGARQAPRTSGRGLVPP